ncbi:MAG: YgiQ family radical SAM protein [Bacteroidaceae bacterium]|nr:YgiQ family radical SAM protein [Bacteroidaceae bacterium]
MEQGRSVPQWLPISVKELERRGWAPGELDVVFFSGDAYVDHPSFGTAVLGRVLEAEGYKVAVVPQPNWQDDLRDFRKFGRPRLFFAVSAGVMDSMVNKYTANRRLRSEDAYTPDGRHDKRPEYPTIVYTQILKRLFPDVPVVIGGIEASMRRLTHYDYWQERLRPSILVDSGADFLIYGMGEQPIVEMARRLERGDDVRTMPQIAFLRDAQEDSRIVSSSDNQIDKSSEGVGDIELASHEECLRDKRAHAHNFRLIEEESNSLHARRLLQRVGSQTVVVNPPYPPMTTEELDRIYDLPYTRLPHPRYKDKRIPAFETVKTSVTIHRGCFGGCAFCTISAHQGKFIVSRSEASIVREVRSIARMPDFKGYISDLGGPSANMYRMGGKDKALCARCRRPSCLHPVVCRNLDTSHKPLLSLYRAVDALPEVKKSFIGSGVRYDLVLASADKEEYARELITHHVSGRLKVAPEHTSESVLNVMRKPSFKQFEDFNRLFVRICREGGLSQQLIPYFISSHPGCTAEDMAELAAITRRLHFQLEQVQDFTPTPMTVSTTAWYTGVHPYTMKPLFCARSPQEKLDQRRFFFWYRPEERRAIVALLRRIRRADLIDKLFGPI